MTGTLRTATRSIAVTRVNVIDATGAPIKRDMTVVIDDGTISAVVLAARARVPANAQVVDGMGKFMIPRLAALLPEAERICKPQVDFRGAFPHDSRDRDRVYNLRRLRDVGFERGSVEAESAFWVQHGVTVRAPPVTP